MTDDEQYLRRAIRLAMNGRGLVEPNPMVGCVIVKDGRVIGEGFHQKYGHPHAEPNALAGCTESPEGATAFVTLEPCCHTNKQTPPCVPRLIAAKISRVVIGCLDPNPDVNGNGVRQLRDAGIVVDGPMLEAECKQLIAVFKKHWFYVTLKWAESADGKIAGPGGQRLQISNPASSRAVQGLRSRCDAIAVGINTVIADNPVLLPRGIRPMRSYRRMVLDTNLRIPLDCNLVNSADQGSVEVYCCNESPNFRSDRLPELVARGVKIFQVELDWGDGTQPTDGTRLKIESWYYQLYCKINHLLVEPGPTLARSLFPTADRLWIVRSKKIVGDKTAPSAAALPDFFVQTGEMDLDGDVLCEYLNKKSNVFFAAVPSADFVLAQTEPGRAGPERADRGDTPRL